MIIDFHTHTFPEKISAKVVDKLGKTAHTAHFTDASIPSLINSMVRARVDYSVNLPVMTTTEQVEKVNHSLMAQAEELRQRGIITFGGMHPNFAYYKDELKYLHDGGILGIKIHPAYQNVDFDDIRMKRIIDYASQLGLIVVTHAGIDIGIYDHNYASVPMILNVLEEVQPTKLVLAHMGNWACWDEFEKDLAGAPVYIDTAFSLGPITPNPEQQESPYLTSNLSDEAFVRLVRKHGIEKVLFATDSPWEDQKEYISRIHQTSLTEKEKEYIFEKNAKRLLF
ncbi:MAG: amidohydrolase family protein [Lachnospiraceae bacterium]